MPTLTENPLWFTSFVSSHFPLGPFTPAIMNCSPDRPFWFTPLYFTHTVLLHGISFSPMHLSPKSIIWKAYFCLSNWSDCSFLGVPSSYDCTFHSEWHLCDYMFLTLTRLWSWEQGHIVFFKKNISIVLGTVPGQCEVLTKWANVEGNWFLNMWLRWNCNVYVYQSSFIVLGR